MKKYDLHTHTRYSDGICTPEEIVKAAKEKGMTGVAISDHDTVGGLKEAKEAGKKYKIEIIPAVEITTEMGDILALGIEQVPQGTPMDILVKIRQLGGVVIIAHPMIGNFQTSFASVIKMIKDKIDAIEIYNATTPDEFNFKAVELAKKHDLVGVAGSDAHIEEKVGSAHTKCPDNMNILEAIKQGKVEVAWE